MSSNKQGWKTQSGFIWAVLGSVVGFANVLSFSAQCYKNGGGAFLIPYFCAYVIMGIPLLFLEGLIGQKMKRPLVSAYGKVIGNPGKFFGWLAVIGCLTIGSFYIVLTGYSLLYTYFSAGMQIPSDTASFFKNAVLHSSASIKDFGTFSWMIFIATLFVGGFVWWTLVKDVSKGIEKICSFAMPLLTAFVIGFAIVATFLPGAMSGISLFISPNFTRLSDPALWRDVFGQLFFSLSLGLGIIIGYARYNGENVNLKKSMIWVAIGDFVISFIAGWIVFACVGYMSHISGTPFSQMISSDSAFEIGFIIFPKILQTFSPYLQPFIGVVFFFSIFIAGITGVFSIVESVSGNIEDEFKISRKRSVSIALGAIMTLAVFFCYGNGSHLIDSLAPMVLGLNMILSALIEIVVFLYISKQFSKDPFWYKGNRPGLFLYSLKYFVPFVLIAIFIGAIFEEFNEMDLSFVIRAGWLGVSMLLSAVFIRKTSAKTYVAKAS